MFKRLAAIGFIFICTSIAWAILAATIYSRSSASGSSLRGRVQSVWGSELTQQPPVASVDSVNSTGGVETHVLPWSAVTCASNWPSSRARKGCSGSAPTP